MGWNRVPPGAAHPIWAGVPDGAYFYFVHSYYAGPADARHSAGEPNTARRFTCALARDNIFATQFHPEKSAAHGLALYRNFLALESVSPFRRRHARPSSTTALRPCC